MPQGARTMTFFVPEAFLARVVEQYGFDSRRIEIIPQFLTPDPVMESVLTRLAIEAQTGSPSGQLCWSTSKSASLNRSPIASWHNSQA